MRALASVLPPMPQGWGKRHFALIVGGGMADDDNTDDPADPVPLPTADWRTINRYQERELARLRRDTDKIALRQSFAEAALTDMKLSVKEELIDIKKNFDTGIAGVASGVERLNSTINGVMRTAVYTVFGALFVAFMAWVVSGGMKVPH
jgi:hypothetical protein